MISELLTWPMIFLGGLLGSAHCVGMCGGFAMMVGATTSSALANLIGQLIYTAGRIATYALLGGVVGGLGTRFTRAMPSVAIGQSLLAILAGSLLLVEGLKAAGLWPARLRPMNRACPWRNGFAALLHSGHPLPIFVAGFATGWLPCGLVFAFLALAGQRGSLAAGVGTMLAFGAGTIPLMILIGMVPGCLSLPARRRLLRVAAGCVIATAILTLARGATLANSLGPLPAPAPHCPLCRD